MPDRSRAKVRGQRTGNPPVAPVLPTGDKNNVTIEDVNALGVFESRVMEAVWALNREVAVAEILEWMQNNVARDTPDGQRPRRIAYTSVLTTVINLVEKGFLNQDRNPSHPTYKNAFMYTAKLSKAEYRDIIARALTQMAAKVSYQAATDTLHSWRSAGEEKE